MTTSEDLLSKLRQDDDFNHIWHNARAVNDIAIGIIGMAYALDVLVIELAKKIKYSKRKLSRMVDMEGNPRISELVDIADRCGFDVRINFVNRDVKQLEENMEEK